MRMNLTAGSLTLLMVVTVMVIEETSCRGFDRGLDFSLCGVLGATVATPLGDDERVRLQPWNPNVLREGRTFTPCRDRARVSP